MNLFDTLPLHGGLIGTERRLNSLTHLRSTCRLADDLTISPEVNSQLLIYPPPSIHLALIHLCVHRLVNPFPRLLTAPVDSLSNLSVLHPSIHPPIKQSGMNLPTVRHYSTRPSTSSPTLYNSPRHGNQWDVAPIWCY